MGIYDRKNVLGRSQWPRGLRRGPAAARLLESPVRTPPEAWMSVPRECCLLSGRSLCDGLITPPEGPIECGVPECDREASIMRRPWPTRGRCAVHKKCSSSCDVSFLRRTSLSLADSWYV